MKPVVAIIAQGSMGSAVARRLAENGVEVLTSLAGRSAASAARAREAGMRTVADEEAAAAGAPFVDAGIIGGPPKPGGKGPAFYASGADAPRFAALRDHGLDVRVLDGAIGAASGLKMSYAGITKGFTAIGTASLPKASRHSPPGSRARCPTCTPRPIAGSPRWRKSRVS